MKILTEINVLYVDDETHNLNAFKATFRKEFNVFVAKSALDGLELMKENTMHIVTTDQRMSGMSGIDFLMETLDQYPDAIRVLLIGFTDVNAISEALNKGLVHYWMEKPWNEEHVRTLINAAYEIYLLRESSMCKHSIDIASELELVLR